MSLSTECAAALLSFRYPSTEYNLLSDALRGDGTLRYGDVHEKFNFSERIKTLEDLSKTF